MSKTYDNIEITTTSSDTYSSFEKSYSFDGIYRRIIGVQGATGLGTVSRTIVKTQEIDTEEDETSHKILDKHALTINGDDIIYMRIKSLNSIRDLSVMMFNSDLGTKIFFTIKGDEVMQYHSHVKFDDDSSSVKFDYLAIGAISPYAGADIFIGFED